MLPRFRHGLPLAAALVLGLAGLLPPAFAQATLQTFDDKAAFLAATGAANATGPLPDLGVVPEGEFRTVGSITFSPLAGAPTMYIGGASSAGVGPYWYPPIPAQFIALGQENFQADVAAPVFSMGFEIVEPAATMPAWGGTAGPTTFLVTLYNVSGPESNTQVGQFTFDAPDDVLAFVGVWSNLPFNRLTITDTTGNNDDEYFGQFYTGTTPAPPRTYTSVTSSGSAVPGATGVFTSFPQSPAVAKGGIAFLGLGSAGSSGVYYIPPNPVIPGNPVKVADLFTAIPAGAGTFTGFSQTLASSGVAAFLGAGSAQQGVYITEIPPNPIIPGNPVKVANLSTAIPSGTGAFTGFSALALGDSLAAFLGTGSAQQGVYLSAIPPNPVIPGNPVKVANFSTAIPSGAGAFTSFSALAAGGGLIGFIGSGVAQQGVYISAIPPNPIIPGNPVKVADLASAIPAGSGTFTSFSALSVRDSTVAFVGAGTSQQGVYTTGIPPNPIIPGNPVRVADLATPIPQGTGTFTSFSSVSTSGGHVAFLGSGAGGQSGIYLASILTKVIAVGDTIDGKAVSDLRLGQSGLDGGTLTFGATFADASQAVFAVYLNTYQFSGFFQPVDNLPVLNRVKGGQGVPVKFSLNGNEGLNIFAAGYPKSEQIVCDANASVDGIDQTVTAGASSLSYTSGSDQYTYVWKTEKTWANTCRQFVLRLKDGIAYRANFKFD